jgi:hypothetical protein
MSGCEPVHPSEPAIGISLPFYCLPLPLLSLWPPSLNGLLGRQRGFSSSGMDEPHPAGFARAMFSTSFHFCSADFSKACSTAQWIQLGLSIA